MTTGIRMAIQSEETMADGTNVPLLMPLRRPFFQWDHKPSAKPVEFSLNVGLLSVGLFDLVAQENPKGSARSFPCCGSR